MIIDVNLRSTCGRGDDQGQRPTEELFKHQAGRLNEVSIHVLRRGIVRPGTQSMDEVADLVEEFSNFFDVEKGGAIVRWFAVVHDQNRRRVEASTVRLHEVGLKGVMADVCILALSRVKVKVGITHEFLGVSIPHGEHHHVFMPHERTIGDLVAANQFALVLGCDKLESGCENVFEHMQQLRQRVL